MVVMGVTQRGRIDWLIITLLEFAANINLFRASAAIEREEEEEESCSNLFSAWDEVGG